MPTSRRAVSAVINRHGAQKLGRLACCAGIEAAIGTKRQASDLTEDLGLVRLTALRHDVPWVKA